LDNDEALVLAVSCIITIWRGHRWYAALLNGARLRRHVLSRLLLGVMPIVCLAIIEFVLRRWAAVEVRTTGGYQFLFLAAGGVWLVFLTWVMPIFGIDPRIDAIDNGNSAACVAVCGAMLGMSICYAGANIGEGATIWMTFFPAVVGAALILGLWMFVEMTSGISAAIAIERDLASGVRLAGLLIAIGLILARAAAGDWVSIDATLQDFVRLGWPAALMAVIFSVVDRLFQPTPSRPKPSIILFGVMPMVAYCALTWLVVRWRR
jgi:uncharacterized membrane protein YjfL (UPF0719 family)